MWNPRANLPLLSLTLLVFLTAAGDRCEAIEQVQFERAGRRRSVAGELLVQATDGGVLLLAQDGQLWGLQPAEISRRETLDLPFLPWDADQFQASLLEELSDRFRFHQTAHFLIAYDTSQAYAQWCGSLYERLYRALVNYWTRRGVALTEPQFPLVAIVFASRDDYLEYASKELGASATGIVGYYSLRTNRVVMYDLTGVEQRLSQQSSSNDAQRINRILSQPSAEPSVATLVHEATHQVAYNTGLQTRYADNPLWLSEGLAVYFETPDLSSSKGWRGIGRMNAGRLAQLRQYLARRPPDSLRTLLTDDQRLRDSDTAADAYAEAWGLCYFLLQRRDQEFARYVQELATLKPLGQTSPEERIAVFEKHFGNLAELDRRFVNEVANWKLP